MATDISRTVKAFKAMRDKAYNSRTEDLLKTLPPLSQLEELREAVGWMIRLHYSHSSHELAKKYRGKQASL